MVAFCPKTQPQQQTQQLPADQDVGLMLCQRLQRWSSIKTTFVSNGSVIVSSIMAHKAGGVTESNYLHYLDDMYA